jgi:hypothetical protein
MKTMILAAVAAAGMLSVASLTASAMPIDGAAIARIGQQVDPTVNVKTKKKISTAPCPADQERSNKTGYCRPTKSQN